MKHFPLVAKARICCIRLASCMRHQGLAEMAWESHSLHRIYRICAPTTMIGEPVVTAA
jgi:hypothetical protein